MKKFMITVLAIVLSLSTFTSCTKTDDSGKLPSLPPISSDSNTENGSDVQPSVPDILSEIPGEYYSRASEQGYLEELLYDTYESFSYGSENKPLTKRAIVYLPYGYSDENKYNVLYLMHGGWSNETGILGVPENPSDFKNVIDNAIENGVFAPLIIVCPTYNNTNENGQDSD
ncbi:MAG: esterase, partial [Eubacteriales bacterium]